MKKLFAAMCFLLLATQVFSAPTFIDLTHSFNKKTLYWPTATPFVLKKIFAGNHHRGYFYASNDFSLSEHVGTHMDAPYHFDRLGVGVAGVPLNHLIGPGIVINVAAKARANPNYQVSIKDFKQWIKHHGPIPKHAFILLNTGYNQYWPNRKAYTGTRLKGQRGLTKLHFPGLSPAAASWLVKNHQINAIGIDTLSIDYGESTAFLSHRILAKANIPFFENVANLNKLPAKGFTVYGLPMKIEGASGAPARVLAVMK